MFLGIDLGTSFIKGAVLDPATYQVSYVYRIPFPDPIPGLPPLYREFDPRQVIAAVRTVLDKLIPYADRCEGIVMCSQMHGVVFCTATGEARSNLINWEDQRGLLPHPSGNGSFFDRVRASLDTSEIHQLGNELRPGMPIVLLSWYAQQPSPPPPGLIAAPLPDFVVANLCENIPVTDLTHAAAHGLLNMETLDWHHAAIDKLQLQQFQLPEIRPQGEVIGYLNLSGRSVPCYMPVGDYQCALVGALLRQGELSLNISTGSQISLLTSAPVFGDFETRPYFDQQFTSTVTHIPAGRALNALVALLSELAVAQQGILTDPWAYIIQEAEAAGSTEMQVNLAFYSSPVGDRGTITNIRESELSVGHLFRAAFQNMADNYYGFALRLSPEKAWNNLVFSGGLPQKISLLRSLIADKFQVRYRMSPHPEDTLVGLLILAAVFARRADSLDQASNLAHKALTDTPSAETR